MAEVNNSGILIRDVETKNIMTKSTLPVEAIYRAYRTMGHLSGCETLACH